MSQEKPREQKCQMSVTLEMVSRVWCVNMEKPSSSSGAPHNQAVGDAQAILRVYIASLDVSPSSSACVTFTFIWPPISSLPAVASLPPFLSLLPFCPFCILSFLPCSTSLLPSSASVSVGAMAAASTRCTHSRALRCVAKWRPTTSRWLLRLGLPLPLGPH